MKDYIVINGVTYDLVKREEAVAAQSKKLADAAAGDTVKIGSNEMIVLEHVGAATLLLRKESLGEMAFGENNNYNGSDVDAFCNEFADEIAGIVGEDNILPHEVDLTSDDGLKDYGKIQRNASLLTADLYREYVAILDKYKIDAWWWLATSFSTPAHDDERWVKCVSPSGFIGNCDYDYGNRGVRPFCILRSSIFVSD
ncbi:MAG: hypothetical protein IJF02_05495 [Oscillospiraceae bacterium]|nr:hypothetical protein [Oscillospiraceae bacterium]